MIGDRRALKGCPVCSRVVHRIVIAAIVGAVLLPSIALSVLSFNAVPKHAENLKISLQEQAKKIDDRDTRHSFLENVPANRDLIQAYQRMSEES